MWNCTYCHQPIHDTDWTCWRCRGSRLKPADAYQPQDLAKDASLACLSSTDSSAGGDTPNAACLSQKYSQQITLRELFGLTTLVACCCAFFVNFREDGILFVAMVIGGNLFGVIVGLWVTHVGGLPNDGSAPVYDDEDAVS